PPEELTRLGSPTGVGARCVGLGVSVETSDRRGDGRRHAALRFPPRGAARRGRAKARHARSSARWPVDNACTSWENLTMTEPSPRRPIPGPTPRPSGTRVRSPRDPKVGETLEGFELLSLLAASETLVFTA